MSVLDNTRDEKAIFDDLEALCQQPGYAHIIAVSYTHLTLPTTERV